MGPGYPVATRIPRREQSPVPAAVHVVGGDNRSCGESFPGGVDRRGGGRVRVVAEAHVEAGGVRAIFPFVPRAGRCCFLR